MAKYIIIANDTCDLPENLLKDMDVTMLPLGINIGDETLVNVPPETFYQKLREGAMPTTNAANPNQYIELFESALQAGEDILCLAFSSALSATYSSAVMAAEEMSEKYPDRKIYVVDTRAASLGEGLLVRSASALKKAGKTIDQVRDWVEETKLQVSHWFIVDDLQHLKRGGRVSAAAAVMGGMLGIKPVLRVDDEGRLVPADKARGRQAAIKRLFTQIEKAGVNLSEETVYISHADCYEDAKGLGDEIKEKLGAKDVVINYIGPVIGSHTGIGVIALFFLAAGRE